MALASRGSRDMDQGPEDISDAQMNAQIRLQARAVQLKSMAFGLAATLVVLFV